jgi:hypothetical protein
MSASALHRLALLMLVAMLGCGPSTAASLDGGPAVGRSPDSDLGDETLHTAATSALGDERLVGLLANHPHRIEQVEQLDAEDPSRPTVVVVAFDQPLDDAEYPLDVCAIDTGGQPITGLRWLLHGEDIVAVSPIWGADLTCGS